MTDERMTVQRLMDTVAWETITDQRSHDDGVPYATHQGVLTIGPYSLRVYTLNDGRRLIDVEDFEAFFGFRP